MPFEIKGELVTLHIAEQHIAEQQKLFLMLINNGIIRRSGVELKIAKTRTYTLVAAMARNLGESSR